MPNEKSWSASAASRRATAERRFWDYVHEHARKYDFSKFEYLGATTKSIVVCPDHGEHATKPTYILAGAVCPKCSITRGGAARRMGFEAFVHKARKVHGDKYAYPEQEYTGNKHKLRIICPQHGEFTQKANGHLGGKGCPECSNDSKRARNAAVSALVGTDIIARLQAVHPTLDFSQVVYAGGRNKIEVTCPTHGAFRASPGNMLQGSGCLHCGNERSSEARKLGFDEFVARATALHIGKYSYPPQEYVSYSHPMRIICPTHGEFQQTVNEHLEGCGCQRCAHQLSRGEDAVAAFLSRFTTVEQRDRQLIAPKELDILMPEKKLAVEYCGEYWHSHGDAEDEAAKSMNHYRKYMSCAAQGVRLITLFETEWLERGYAIRRLLRNAAGKSRGSVMARKCELRSVSHQDAVAFYNRYHPQGGAGTGAHYGLYWKEKLVACMRFTEGANDRGTAKSRVWTLTRYATRITVTGGASKLFTAFLKEYKPKEVKSFSDNRYFEGGMYEKLGFCLVEETKPDYAVWHPKLGLTPKPAWQRRSLQTRAKEIGVCLDFDPETDPRTERDITYLLGGRRIYDCGKKRWVWRVDTIKT